MSRLRHSELRRFSEVVGELAEPLPRAVRFSEHLLRSVARLIPIDRVSYNEVDRASGLVINAHSLGEAPSPGLVASLNRHIHEHPGFAHADRGALNPPPTKLSDFLSQRQFRSLGLYSEHFQLYKIHYQLGVNFCVTPTRRISFGLNRGARDFSEEDRTLLVLLRRHLTSAFLRAQAVTEIETAIALRDAALAGTGAALVLFDAAGDIVYRTALAVELWAHYDQPETGAAPAHSPLLAWARRQMFPRPGAVSGLGFSEPPRLTLERAGRQLTATFTRAPQPGGWHLLRLKEQSSAPSAQPLRTLGLSAREAEVLFWLARGKRNAEIALICRLHPTTVSTHLRRIFSKLHVETRTAAAALAWETLAEAQNAAP